jgi:hypothetical protein
MTTKQRLSAMAIPMRVVTPSEPITWAWP